MVRQSSVDSAIGVVYRVYMSICTFLVINCLLSASKEVQQLKRQKLRGRGETLEQWEAQISGYR